MSFSLKLDFNLLDEIEYKTKVVSGTNFDVLRFLIKKLNSIYNPYYFYFKIKIEELSLGSENVYIIINHQGITRKNLVIASHNIDLFNSTIQLKEYAYKKILTSIQKDISEMIEEHIEKKLKLSE